MSEKDEERFKKAIQDLERIQDEVMTRRINESYDALQSLEHLDPGPWQFDALLERFGRINRLGWLCPRCGKVNAPDVKHCDCVPDALPHTVAGPSETK